MPLSSGYHFELPDEPAAARFAAALGTRLGAGDTVLLEGPIGAGKSFIARALIQSLMAGEGSVEDVPSPTFTLVQTYSCGPIEVWHADLYRLGDESEVAELGLEEAFDTALCLVEWPERLGSARPHDALLLSLDPDPATDARRISLTFHDPKWRSILQDLPEVADA